VFPAAIKLSLIHISEPTRPLYISYAVFCLKKCDTQPSWDILGNVGNLSSATILFILQEWLEKRPLQPGDYALAAAFGPGFSAEFLLLQWT